MQTRIYTGRGTDPAPVHAKASDQSGGAVVGEAQGTSGAPPTWLPRVWTTRGRSSF